MAKKFVDNDAREERAIRKVMKDSNVSKSRAIAILKSQGTLKQKKGEKGLKIRKKSKKRG